MTLKRRLLRRLGWVVVSIPPRVATVLVYVFAFVVALTPAALMVRCDAEKDAARAAARAAFEAEQVELQRKHEAELEAGAKALEERLKAEAAERVKSWEESRAAREEWFASNDRFQARCRKRGGVVVYGNTESSPGVIEASYCLPSGIVLEKFKW